MTKKIFPRGIAGAMRIFFILLAAAVGLAWLGQTPAPSTVEIGARLVWDRDFLEPTATLEIRFDEPAVSENELGREASASPMEIRPSLKGSFRWLSTRSGVFTPAEPPALGTTYQVSLRPGLKGPDGKPVKARLLRALQTPPFEPLRFSPSSFSGPRVSSQPLIRIRFNADLDPVAAARFIRFVNAEGRQVLARVEPGLPASAWSDYEDAYVRDQTWKERFDSGRSHPQPLSPEETEDEPRRSRDLRKPIPSMVQVSPQGFLPAGKGWKLVIHPGLPALEGGLKTARTHELVIGDVAPFAVESCKVENVMGAGKTITFEFSKRLDPDLTASNILRWISVAPKVPALRADVGGSSVTLHGGFTLGARYQVEVRPGLRAEEPFQLEKPWARTVTFAPIPPRLYFPEVSAPQWSGGHRRFDLLSVNVPDVRFRARRLEGADLVRTMAMFEKYRKGWEELQKAPLEPFAGLDFEQVPGKAVFRRSVSVRAEPDAPQSFQLGWDEVLGKGQPGAVFLAAEREAEGADARPALGTQAVVQVTDLGVMLKRTGGNDPKAAGCAWVYVFSIGTGQPLEGASVQVLDREGHPFEKATTGPGGLARLSAHHYDRWLLVRRGDDQYAAKIGGNYLSPYGFNIPVNWYGGAADRRRVLLFSDRDVYRPGESVCLKGIVRDWTDKGLVVPTGLRGTLRMTDPGGDEVLRREVKLGETGAFSEVLPLPQGRLGYHHCVVEIGGRGYGRSVQVQECEPSSFEVKIDGPAEFGAAAKPSVAVSAKYYMGKALSRARLKWSLQGYDDGFHPAGFDEYAFCSDEDYVLSQAGMARGSLALQGEGALGPKGDYAVAPEVPLNPAVPQPRRCNLLVEISDIDQKTVSESASFVRHASDFYLGIKRPRDVVREGEAVPLELVAVGADGRPWAAPVPASLQLTRCEWRNVRVQGAGRSHEYRSELIREPAGRFEVPVCGSGSISWRSAKPGAYLMEARAKDASGRAVVTAMTFQVYGKGEADWGFRNPAQVDLVPDKPSYKEGEEAVILVKSPIEGVAQVTLEREGVFSWFMAPLKGGAPVVRVPIRKEHAPNVFVSLVLIRGARHSSGKIPSPEYRYGYCELKVERPETRLALEVRTDAAEYRPGQGVTVSVEAKDGAGAPAAGAEVALYAVDEGMLSLTGYRTPDPHAFFYQPRELAVNTCLSLPQLFAEDPNQWSFTNKGYLVGGGGDEGRARIRRNFLACAFWKAALTADAKGRVSARFNAPDGLTRYRVVAVASRGGGQFGSAEGKFEVNKRLMLEPSLPRFANVGDKLVLRAVVHNQSTKEGEVTVRVKFDGKVVESGSEERKSPAELVRSVKLGAKQTSFVDFPLHFRETGVATWTWSAQMGGSGDDMQDAVETKLNVGYPVPLLREMHVGRAQGRETSLLKEVNPQILEGSGTVVARVANTRLIELSGAVKHLFHYPYGCVEQTVSSLIPWLVLRENRSLFPELKAGEAETEDAIRKGVNRILMMQTEGGGLSYWPGGREPMLWASAYGGVALALSGNRVPASNMDLLTKYLSGQLRKSAENNDRFDLGPRCLALYALALAGKPEPAYHEVLFKKRDLLSPENRALLALAILKAGGDRKMAGELLAPRKDPQPAGDEWFGCGSREIALRLMAWSQLRPSAREVDVLAEELLRARKQGHWRTTQGNAWSIYALAEYGRRVEKARAERKPVSGALAWGGRRVPFKVDASKPVAQEKFDLNPSRGKEALLLLNPQQGLLFSSVEAEARPKAWEQPRQDRDFSVKWAYSRVDDDGKLLDLGVPRVGDRVLVTLELEARAAAHYVAVEDPLPSVFEALNPEFKTQATRVGEATEFNWFSDFRELREDRALFFRDHLPPGKHVLRYVARVRAAGAATAPSAKVEEMYHPEHFGMSGTCQVKTAPME